MSDAAFSKAHSKSVYRIVKMYLKILFRKEGLSCERRQCVGRLLCVAENIFWGMRNPDIGFVRIQDGSMAKTNREELRHAGESEGGQRGGARRKFTLAATSRECTPGQELCSSCGYRPSDADRGWKGEGKRAQSGESLWGITVVAHER